MTVVSNTSPITNLAGIGQLDLLHQLYGTVIIPQAVYKEMVGLSTTVPGTLECDTSVPEQTFFSSLRPTPHFCKN